MLSAKELVETRDKPVPDLPSFGSKDFEPDGTSEQLSQIQDSISEIENIISYQRVKVLGSLSQAVWRPELNLAEVTHQVGSYWSAMGHVLNQKVYIYAEEALYLLEIGALEISYNKVPLSVQRAYFVLINQQNGLTIEQYRVYSHLNAHGYKVLRHSPLNTVTKYEKQLEVHKLGIKLKASSSKFKIENLYQKPNEVSSEINVKSEIVENKFPISYDKNCDVKEVLKKIELFKPHIDTGEGSLNFDFDIYSELSGKHGFKKSCLQLPTYRVIVHSSDHLMPELKEICMLSKKYKDEIPVIHAIVFPDYVAFYEINPMIASNIND